MIAGRPVEICERATDNNRTVRLKCCGINWRIRASAGMECGVRRSVGIESRKVVHRRPIKAREKSAHDDFAIGLMHKSFNNAICARSRIERRVEFVAVTETSQ